MKGQIIYQFCLANYNTEKEYLNRIKRFLKVLKRSTGKIKNPLMPLSEFKNLDGNKMILMDIIPSFFITTIHEFTLIPDFDELKMFSMVEDIINKMDRTKKNDPNSIDNIDPTIVIKFNYLVQLTPKFI